MQTDVQPTELQLDQSEADAREAEAMDEEAREAEEKAREKPKGRRTSSPRHGHGHPLLFDDDDGNIKPRATHWSGRHKHSTHVVDNVLD